MDIAQNKQEMYCRVFAQYSEILTLLEAVSVCSDSSAEELQKFLKQLAQQIEVYRDSLLNF